MTLHRKASILLLVAVATCAILPLYAATIIWDEPQNVSADADVSTEGDFVCAYNENAVDATVNGVLFRGYTSHGLWPVNAVEPDVQLANFGESRANTFCPNFTSSGALSASYQNLLHGAAFNRNTGTTATATLLGLQPGEEYLVQVWINDNRGGIGNYSTVLDGGCTLNSHPSGASYGQYAIGRFRADSSQQTITLYSDRSPILNAIQVRKLPSIAWGEPQLIGDGSEVENSGTTLYAYHFRNNSTDYSVNGVTFKDGANNRMVADVGLAHDGGEERQIRTGGGTLDQKTVYPEETPDEYKAILKTCLYLYVNSSGPAWLDMTFKNLVPGRKYAVQFWHLDARYNNETCTIYQKIDGVRSLYPYNSAEGYLGQTVTGVFIAGSTNKTIRLRGYNVSVDWRNNPLVNALQVRDITDIADEGLTVPLSSEAAVRTDGELVYAYTARNEESITVNGVPFAAQTSPSSWGNGNVQLTGFTSRTDSAFYSNPNDAFHKLLAAGVYARATEVNNMNPAPATLTFNGLEPSKKYLIQVFVNDSRTGTEDRVVKFSDQLPYVRYANSGVIVVRPQTSSYVMNLLYTADSWQNISPQVNAVQVRRLPDAPADALTWNGGSSGTWTTGSTGWTGSGELPETPWTAENGAERDAVVGDGTTLTVGEGVTARNLIALGSLTLNGLPTLTGEISGGNVTVTSALTVDTLVKSRDGILTFTGNRSSLRQAIVNGGTLALTADDSSDLRRILVCTPGTLKVCGTGTIFSGYVSGTLETSGALTASADVEFADGWILRRTGGAAMIVDCETFDLSTIAEIQIPDSAAFCAGSCEVLWTTGSFTGELPPLVTDVPSARLEVVRAEGYEALRFAIKGMCIIFR